MTTNESLHRPFSDEVTLRAIVEGIESETGERFFSSLVKQLASAFRCQYAFVSELLSDHMHFRTRAAWGRGKLMENFEIPLMGTPCEPVLRGNSTYHPENLCKLFPTNPPFLSEWGVESYCGVPLVDSSGAVTGHLAILSEEPMKDGPRGLAIMRIFAARAQAEIERLRAENALRVSEERLNRVLQSALDAIVTFDANRNVVLFNHSAESVFRCSAADAIGRALDPFLSDKLKEVIEGATSPDSGPEPRYSWAFDGLTARRASGDEFAIEGTISHVETKAGKLFTLILRDIEERLRAETKARELSLRLIVDSIPAPVALMTTTGEVESVNRPALEYFGKTLEELKRWGTSDAVHPDDLSHAITVWKEANETGQPYEVKERLRRFDGVYRWFDVRGFPLRNPGGHILNWCVLLNDVEDRKRTEEQLRRSEAFLSEAQRLSSTGSFLHHVVTEEVTFSEEMCRIFELEPPVSVGMIASRIHPDDLPVFIDELQRSRREGYSGRVPSDVGFDLRLLLPDGSVKYIRIISHAVVNESGQLESIGTAQDVTQRMLAEEALANARTKLAHMARVTSLGALTASIAHEVNQPLSGIITNTDTGLWMLESDPPNVDGARETVRRALRDANRAAEVIKRLRALFSTRQVTVESVDLNEMTREVIALSLSELQRNQVLLRTDFDSDLPRITGDRVQLQQVILNLLRNASDAMTAVQDRPRHLLIRTEREKDDRVLLTVQDVGVGFDPATMDQLFQPFYTTKDDGMGMGLSISRSIIESHRGRLWATRNDGPGATFCFSLPCGREGGTAAGDGSL